MNLIKSNVSVIQAFAAFPPTESVPMSTVNDPTDPPTMKTQLLAYLPNNSLNCLVGKLFLPSYLKTSYNVIHWPIK